MVLDKLDLGIIGLYLAGITLFGLRFRKKQRTLRDYFLADRNIPWWAIALSIVAAETSTLTIISIPGLAYDTNLTFLQVVLGYVVGRFIISFVLLPHYFRGDLYTAYELIERRFGKKLRSLTAGLFLVTRAAAEGVRVYAVSIVVAIALGTGEVASIAIITALTLVYTFEGGLAAVIWTDVVQTVIYVGGTLVGLFTILHLVPGGWPAIHHMAAADRQAAGVRLHARLLEAVHILGGADRRSFSDYRQSRYRSAHCATPSGGAKPTAVGDRAALERSSDSFSVRSLSHRWCHAVRVLSRAFGKLRTGGQDLSDIHRQPDAARDFRIAHCGDSGRGHVEPERGA